MFGGGGGGGEKMRNCDLYYFCRCKILDTLSIVDCLRLKLTDEESQTVLVREHLYIVGLE